MDPQKFFIAIGPAKTGTTWLYRNLVAHPEVWMPAEKEIAFFWEQEFLEKRSWVRDLTSSHWYYRRRREGLKGRLRWYVREFPGWKRLRWEARFFFGTRNLNWYTSLFDTDKLSGDVTPKYSELTEKSIQSIYRFNPHTKIIITLRDPIEREWSRARMNLVWKKGLSGIDNISTARFLKQFEQEGPRRSNNYVQLVKRWKAVFPEEQVCVLYFDELQKNPREFLRKVCSFLDIDTSLSLREESVINEGIPISLPKELEAHLVRLNYPFIQSMAEHFKSEYPKLWLKRYASVHQETL